MARRAFILFCFLLSFSGSTVTAKLLGGGDPIDRGGNRPWEWCPCTNDADSASCVRFSAEKSAVLVRFRAVTHTTIDNTCCCQPNFVGCEGSDTLACLPYYPYTVPPPYTKYMRQRIDNIMVIEAADFFANLERAGFCESCDTLFAFDRLADNKFVFRELFDSGVDSRWDLSAGAFFDPAASAPATLALPSAAACPDPTTRIPFSGPGGSLGFGSADSPPDPPECCPEDEVRQYANTRMLIAGLRPDTPYVLSFWWASDRDENCSGPPVDELDLRNGDLTVSVYSCDLEMGFRVAPHQMNLAAHGGFVTGYLEPPAGHSIDELDQSSITLLGQVHPAAGVPTAIGDFDGDGRLELKLKFPRDALRIHLSAGTEVPIDVSGFATGDECFSGTDAIRVRAAPGLASPAAGSVLIPGTKAEVRWAPGRGTVDLLFSADDGLTWNVEARSIPNTGLYAWTVPWLATQHGRLAVGKILAIDPTGPVFDSEVGEAGPFTIASTSDVASHDATFSLLGVSPNPTRRSFTLTFALPSSAPASVTVYDVKGRLVAVNAVSELGPGLHTMTLGERNPLPAGVYLVRLTQAGKSVTARATIIP